MKAFQLPIARSTGASARAEATETRDDGTGRQLALDGEVGAEPEQGRLQHHAEHARDRGEAPVMSLARSAARDARQLASLKRSTARPAKPIALRTSALRALQSAMPLRSIAALRVDTLRRRVMISLTTVSTSRTNAPAKVSAPSSRMEEVDEREIDRHPRQVEQRRGALAAEEAADRVDVTPALQRFGGGEAEARHVDGDAVRQGRDLPVDPGADPHQHLGANDVEAALEQIEPDRQADSTSRVGMLPLVSARS